MVTLWNLDSLLFLLRPQHNDHQSESSAAAFDAAALDQSGSLDAAAAPLKDSLTTRYDNV